jgi:hypothetical protein
MSEEKEGAPGITAARNQQLKDLGPLGGIDGCGRLVGNE